MMTLAGSFDHRLIDGETAAKFMARISEVAGRGCLAGSLINLKKRENNEKRKFVK